jgi:formylmethanofuran dehydrogenase subunit B
VKPVNVKKSVSLIKRNELRVGSSVFYTTNDPGSFHNNSIRFTTFWKGKITSVGKLHRDIITVNSYEVNWKTQVVTGK